MISYPYSPESRIANRYEVAGKPLFGGMGLVYLCYDHSEGRPVALKTIRPELLRDRAARDRFLREGTTWIGLGRHPHIVRCFSVERLNDNREVYLVLELVAKDPEQERRDASLRSWLIPGQPLPTEVALLFALQIAQGMQHATDTLPGFVHRDLKPENILVGADRMHDSGVNRLRVTDFGLAQVLSECKSNLSSLDDVPKGSHSARTQLTHGIVGTPLYMAPEQWRGEPLTPAADVYAFGCILYEMLSGRFAVEPEHAAQAMEAHLAGAIEPLSQGTPEHVRELVEACLTQKPEERPESWEAVIALLLATYEHETGQRVPALSAAVELSREERLASAWARNSLGISYLDIGKSAVAADYFSSVKAAGESEQEPNLHATGLTNLGNAYFQLGDVQRAVGYHLKAISVHQDTQNKLGEANELNNLGNAYGQLGDMWRAVGYYEKALTTHQEINNEYGKANALTGLGVVYLQLGDVKRSIECSEEALSIHRKLGDRQEEGDGLTGLGIAYLQVGDLRKAIECYKQALVIRQETGNRRGEGSLLSSLGNAHRDLGNPSQAIAYHEKALVISRELGDQYGEGKIFSDLGHAYLEMGDPNRAIRNYDTALTIYRELDDKQAKAMTLRDLALAYFHMDDFGQAIAFFERAQAMYLATGNQLEAAACTLNIAIALAKQSEVDRSLPLVEEALAIFKQLGHEQYAQKAGQIADQLRDFAQELT